MHKIILSHNYHQGVGARQIGRHCQRTAVETITPNPAKQLHTAGGHPRVKHVPHPVNDEPDNPATAVMQPTQDNGPACTFMMLAIMMRTIRTEEVTGFDILFS